MDTAIVIVLFILLILVWFIDYARQRVDKFLLGQILALQHRVKSLENEVKILKSR